MAAAPWIVSDELWELVKLLLPKRERRFRYPGRKRRPDREALQRARARLTEPETAPNTTSSSTAREYRSPGRATTLRN